MSQRFATIAFTTTALALIAGCGGSSGAKPAHPTSTPFTLAGSAQTDDVGPEMPGEPCEPGNLRDLRQGAQVTVTDATGKILAVSELGRGISVAEDRPDGKTDWWCRFAFAVVGVPATSDFYGLQIAQQPVKRYAAADIAKPNLVLTFLK